MIFRVGAAIVVASPVAWVVAVFLLDYVHASDTVWARCISSGSIAGVISLLCVSLGKTEGGRGRIGWILAAFVETFCWWFMVVGL